MPRATLALSTLLATATATAALAEDRPYTLPDYRAWGAYMISDRIAVADQAVRLYANPQARAGARADGTLPYGSVLIMEVWKVERDDQGAPALSDLGRRIAETHAVTLYKTRIEGTDARLADGHAVGDWDFAVFSPAGENLGKDVAACRACHADRAADGFVWSLPHIAAPE